MIEAYQPFFENLSNTVALTLENRNHEHALQMANEDLLQAKHELELLIEERTQDLTATNQSLLQEIEERKRIQKALLESESKYKDLFENANDAIFLIDTDKNYIDVNRKAVEIFGYSKEEFLNMNIFDVIPEEQGAQSEMEFLRLSVKGHYEKFTGKQRTKDGHFLEVEVSSSAIIKDGKIVGSRDIVRDITERKRIEKQLRQAQKMEAIGTLAGGIAHDFNNILSAILGYTELALNDAEKESALYHSLKEVLRAGERAADLVTQILTFSRQAEQERKPVQVKLICKEALKFLRASLPTSIEIRPNIQSDSLVMADPTQIHQVLMNLCTNAGHAMGETGGVLEVTLADVEPDADFMADHPEIKPGAYLELTVDDRGHVIPKYIMDRIFDPFFTTKEKGDGTGMGLAVVHGIVGSCGGTITASSEPGRGSSFKVYLPAVKRQTEPHTYAEEPIAGGTERILFVDDEPALVNIGKQLLESLGYKVSTRTSSLEALELFKAGADRFDLVITDMTMPKLAGDDLAKELMRISPETPVILCTGYSSRISLQQALAIGIRAFVSKPVLKKEIAETIRKVLDEK
jgi:PAS domain S-box-containing protein